MPNLSYHEITETCELLDFVEDSSGTCYETWVSDEFIYKCVWLPANTGVLPTTIFQQ